MIYLKKVVNTMKTIEEQQEDLKDAVREDLKPKGK